MSNDIKSKVDDTAEEVTPEEIANSNEPALVLSLMSTLTALLRV